MRDHDLPSRSGPLNRAIVLARAHSQVAGVTVRADGDHAAVDVAFRVNLPSDFKRAGESPSGVRPEETVRFHFPRDYPMLAPEPSLREDFSRSHPHMQPWLRDGRPVPCIYDGDVRELLHHEGFAGLLNQTALWLDRSADGSLIDPEQGWEPVRRDSCGAVLDADADMLRNLGNRTKGYRFLRLIYMMDSKTRYIVGRITNGHVPLDSLPLPYLFSEARNGLRNSLALVVWPKPVSSDQDVTCNTYLPETVGTVSDLKTRATEYHCARSLENGLTQLKLLLSAAHGRPRSFVLAVVLLAHRPYHVVGSESAIELCPYVVDDVGPDYFAKGDATPVHPAAHRDPVSRRLLVQMSGGDSKSRRTRWTLIGAGSLGSKIALHLTRSGQGPEVVVDHGGMSPHNAARHALPPRMGTKADLLCESLKELDQSARPVVADAGATSIFKPNDIWSRDSWAVVNTTASLAVHEAISASRAMKARAVEVSLFGGGRVGIISVEGPNRSPNAGDLMAEFYANVADDQTLKDDVFGAGNQTVRRPIGQGCGSLTMPMSDGRVSLFAAGMAEYLLAKQRDGLPRAGGQLLIGRLSADGLGPQWQSTDVPPVTLVDASLNGECWSIDIHARADARMQEEVARYKSVETGGVLVGLISEASRAVHVVDAVKAPKDSVRTANEFLLGKHGLARQLEAISESVGYSLYCIGTWHSHLSASGPSETDRATAEAASLARFTPSVFLIRAIDGYRAILDDSVAPTIRRTMGRC